MAAITLTVSSLGANKPALQSSVAPASAGTDDVFMASKADNDGYKSDIEGRVSAFATAHATALTALETDFDSVVLSLSTAHNSAVSDHGTRKSGFDNDLNTEISAEGTLYSDYNTALAANLTAMKAKATAIKAGSASLQVSKLSFVVGSDTVEVTLDDSGDISYVKV